MQQKKKEGYIPRSFLMLNNLGCCNCQSHYKLANLFDNNRMQPKVGWSYIPYTFPNSVSTCISCYGYSN